MMKEDQQSEKMYMQVNFTCTSPSKKEAVQGSYTNFFATSDIEKFNFRHWFDSLTPEQLDSELSVEKVDISTDNVEEKNSLELTFENEHKNPFPDSYYCKFDVRFLIGNGGNGY